MRRQDAPDLGERLVGAAELEQHARPLALRADHVRGLHAQTLAVESGGDQREEL
jgi:hypothetical protein